MYVIQGKNEHGQWQSGILGDETACRFETYDDAAAAIDGLILLGGDWVSACYRILRDGEVVWESAA